MAKATEEQVLDLPETLTKTEAYIEENKNSLSIIVTAIVIIIGGYLFYSKYYVVNQEEEARSQMYMAELYFKKDSLQKALNGDGQFPGFLSIIDDYGVTPSANLAELYSGLSYLRLGQFQDAIGHLENFDSDDAILAPIAIGAMGDASLELGNKEAALEYYLDAADKDDNTFTPAVYLMKAALVQELLGKSADALSTYERIKKDYPESREAQGIDKYIAKATALAGK
ncbi:MAG: tetratricopeptide repeat protein [Flavobacteriales bacterium]|nr:tetratricopeptide repeat protein [Flavobacteriales bacterium]